MKQERAYCLIHRWSQGSVVQNQGINDGKKYLCVRSLYSLYFIELQRICKFVYTCFQSGLLSTLVIPSVTPIREINQLCISIKIKKDDKSFSSKQRRNQTTGNKHKGELMA